MRCKTQNSQGNVSTSQITHLNTDWLGFRPYSKKSHWGCLCAELSISLLHRLRSCVRAWVSVNGFSIHSSIISPFFFLLICSTSVPWRTVFTRPYNFSLLFFTVGRRSLLWGVRTVFCWILLCCWWCGQGIKCSECVMCFSIQSFLKKIQKIIQYICVQKLLYNQTKFRKYIQFLSEV